MPFFTNDHKLASEYNDPGSQATQPLARPNVGQSTLSSTSALGDPYGLGNLSQLLNSNQGSQNINTGLGGIPGMFSTPGTTAVGGVTANPIGLYPAAYDTRGVGFGDSSETTGVMSSYQSLQDWLNASSFERNLAGKLFPGGKFALNAIQGINPTGVGPATFDWYGGETDYFGNPLSASDVSGMLTNTWTDEDAVTGLPSNSYNAWTEAEFEDDFGFNDTTFYDSNVHSDWTAAEFSDDFSFDDNSTGWSDADESSYSDSVGVSSYF